MIIITKTLLLVTNNGKALEAYGAHSEIDVDYREERSYLDVLIRARDLVHKGWHLMSHPQASNLKPNQSPYKTVLLSNGREIQAFAEDVEMIEAGIAAFHKFTGGMIPPKWSQKALRDFQTIDLSVVESALGRALRL